MNEINSATQTKEKCCKKSVIKKKKKYFKIIDVHKLSVFLFKYDANNLLYIE